MQSKNRREANAEVNWLWVGRVDLVLEGKSIRVKWRMETTVMSVEEKGRSASLLQIYLLSKLKSLPAYLTAAHGCQTISSNSTWLKQTSSSLPFSPPPFSTPLFCMSLRCIIWALSLTGILCLNLAVQFCITTLKYALSYPSTH